MRVFLPLLNGILIHSKPNPPIFIEKGYTVLSGKGINTKDDSI